LQVEFPIIFSSSAIITLTILEYLFSRDLVKDKSTSSGKISDRVYVRKLNAFFDLYKL
jgi:hypothetical protein